MLDTLLDERLAAYSPEVLKTIKAYSKQMDAAQLKLHNELNEYKRYNLSVRSLLSTAMNKTGAENRKALGMHL